MDAISLTQNTCGQFTVSYKNGMLLTEANEISFAKHNLLCFGRLNKNFTKNPRLRKGSLGSVLESRDLYSTCWLYYLEGAITSENLKNLVNDFNKACDRDFQAGLINKRITLNSVTKLDKNTLQFKIQISSQQQEITINLT